MEKTINELNSHGWYRLVKVLYIGAFAIIAILGLLTIFYSNQPTVSVDNTKTTIDCNYPTPHTITAADGEVFFPDSGLTFPNGTKAVEFTEPILSAFQTNGSGYLSNEIQAACGMTTYVNNLTSGNLNDPPPLNSPLFIVHIVYDHQGGWPDIVSYSSLFLLILIGITEGIRRLFYYVVLGSFSPHH